MRDAFGLGARLELQHLGFGGALLSRMAAARASQDLHFGQARRGGFGGVRFGEHLLRRGNSLRGGLLLRFAGISRCWACCSAASFSASACCTVIARSCVGVQLGGFLRRLGGLDVLDEHALGFLLRRR